MKPLKKIMTAAVLAIACTLFISCDEGGISASDASAPGAPENVAATDGAFANKVVVSWDAVEGADTYSVYKSIDTADGPFVRIAGGINVTEYEDATVTVDRVYYYTVSALSGSMEGPQSDADSGYAGEGQGTPPLAPANLHVSGNLGGGVSLAWDASDGALTYTVFRSQKLNGVYDALAEGVDETEYTDATALPGISYYYKVRAVNDDGESAFSNWVSGGCPPPAPAEVGTSVIKYGNKAVITWSAVNGALSYAVYRSDSADGEYTPIAGVIAGLQYEDFTVVADTHYFYKLASVNAIGEGALSAAVEAWAESGGPVLPEAPLNLAASDEQKNQVTVTWDAGQYADTYTVYRSGSAQGPFDGSSVIAEGVAALALVDASVVPGTMYYYRVRSVNADGESALSNTDAGYATDDPADIPTGVQASDGLLLDVTVSWTGAADATSYRVYRSDDPDGPYEMVADSVNGSSWTDENASAGVTRYYRVSSVNMWGESAQSTADGGYSIIEAPTGLVADDGADWDLTITLTWNPVEGAESYVLQRRTGTLGSWSDLVTVSAPTATHVDSGLSLWIQYFYRVRAVAGSFVSGNSDTANAWSN